MSYTAIVINRESRNRLIAEAMEWDALPSNWAVRLHHVTLHMGVKLTDTRLGTTCKFTATHFGITSGRVCAFRVSGVYDSENENPHVTIATAPGAKPVESNAITTWHGLGKSIPLSGIVQICD